MSDLAKIYQDNAGRIQSLVLEKLRDAEAKFFKVLPRGEKAVKVDVHELHGNAPWNFHLPPIQRDYEVAWKLLMDPEGFKAPFGPTTSERYGKGKGLQILADGKVIGASPRLERFAVPLPGR